MFLEEKEKELVVDFGNTVKENKYCKISKKSVHLRINAD